MINFRADTVNGEHRLIVDFLRGLSVKTDLAPGCVTEREIVGDIRKIGGASVCFFDSGFFISGLTVSEHQIGG